MAAEVNDRSNAPSNVEILENVKPVYQAPVLKHLGNVRTLTLGGSADSIGDGNKKPGGT